MKILVYIVSFALMFWALLEQTKEKPNLIIQIIAVAVFFFLMMRLMDKTPGKFDKNEQQNEQ
ncbi:hypothetical protein H1R17_11290 [Flavobacterium sp. xlx-214]|uniref:hypothetical protein n=1 Tax=unclassified Flavobacterium TaxID=196869 RepID=UPI0013D2B699|nr:MULTISPECIES: hypothetical protein [unclassified Flavobacterium]MBA5791799.1 hypothetical protein [Flavobacterium sp. xlx-221]QMI83036.1 hypothetical protein H1R17_11290 [Flavobacterium sp. xlx-214]